MADILSHLHILIFFKGEIIVNIYIAEGTICRTEYDISTHNPNKRKSSGLFVEPGGDTKNVFSLV